MKRRGIVVVVVALFVLTLRVGIATAGSVPSASQLLGQVAHSQQLAQSAAIAQQNGVPNANLPARVLSPGDQGSVAQTSSGSASSSATNTNSTTQAAGQTQQGGGTTSGTQATGQSATNSQAANSGAAATQTGSGNRNISVRVLSPGNDGPVSQQNNVSANSQAQNQNATTQAAGQNQTGGGAGATGVQAVGQSNENAQQANSGATASQTGAENKNMSVRVLSPGDDDSVSQQNNVSASSQAQNANGTTQAAGQDQAGLGEGATGVQAIGQSNENAQQANSGATASQEGARNENISVRVLSAGNDGPVSQQNNVSANSQAQNQNATTQAAGQNQTGGGTGATGVQAVGQSNENAQQANSGASAAQAGADNLNLPVRVLSPGDNGLVTQQNTLSAESQAQNQNATTQAAGQNQTGLGEGATGVQAIGQSNANGQEANSGALAVQTGVQNLNVPVSVLSPGNAGEVSQANTVSAGSQAQNENATTQAAGQEQLAEAPGAAAPSLQTVATPTSARPTSGREAARTTFVRRPSARAPTRSGREAAVVRRARGPSARRAAARQGVAGERVTRTSQGVSPSRAARRTAPSRRTGVEGTRVSASRPPVPPARSARTTIPSAGAPAQAPGAPAACAPTGVQAVGQEAANEQQGSSAAIALQEAINAFMPLAVLSPGSGGAASQQNNASSSSGAGNANQTTQAAGQTQTDLASCGGEQAVGQSVSNQQAANSGALAVQTGAANISAPVQVLSSGGAGAVSQENNVSASSTAQNTNETVQAAGQMQAGTGSGTQAIGQTAQNVQAANSAAVAMQSEALNLSAPVAVLSDGAASSVVQGNAVNAASLAGNANSLIQASGQTQGG